MLGGDPFIDTPRIRVLIVADVRLYRDGLVASLAHRDHLAVVGTAAHCADALQRVSETDPQVVLVDAAMADSLQLMRDLRREARAMRVIAFAVEDTAHIMDCAEAGAAGYVTADASIDDLVVAIERIAREELVCPPHIAATLFRRLSERADASVHAIDQSRALSARELQVFNLIRQGLSNKEIAKALNIAEPTVKNHVHHLLEKLDVTTRAQAVAKISRGHALS